MFVIAIFTAVRRSLPSPHWRGHSSGVDKFTGGGDGGHAHRAPEQILRKLCLWPAHWIDVTAPPGAGDSALCPCRLGRRAGGAAPMMATHLNARILLARGLFVSSAALLCVAGACGVGLGTVRAWQPDADLGTVKQGGKLTHNVCIANYTFRVIQIEAVPACGCTVTGESSRMLGPFASVMVPLTYNVGKNQLGKVARQVNIGYTSGGSDQRLVVRAAFTVVR